MSVLGTNHKIKRMQNMIETASKGSNLISEPVKLAQIHNNHYSSISRIDDIPYSWNYNKNDISYPAENGYNRSSSNYRCEYAKFGEICWSNELCAKWKSYQMNGAYTQYR